LAIARKFITRFGRFGAGVRSEPAIESALVRVAVLLSIWGLAGAVWLVARALWTLTPVAWEAVSSGVMGPFSWTLLSVWVVVNAYAEGYVGFHQKFSPRAVDRALFLGRNPTWLRAVLAPVFCMGLFHASRRTLISSWVLLVGIVLLVLAVRSLPQPWRGIVDAGVVVGLGLGLASLLWHFVTALWRGREPSMHDVPVEGRSM
jgi:hypothetical protein